MLNYFCEQIPGDAMLYSMFKIDSEPVKCPTPLKGKKQSVASICLMIRNFQQSTRLFACMNSCAHSNTDVCGRAHSGDVKLVAACN